MNKYWLITLLSLLSTNFSPLLANSETEEDLILSTPDEIHALSEHTDHLIGGIISPLNGHPCIQKTDLIANGAQPLFLNRIFISPSMPSSFHPTKENDLYALLQHMNKQYRGWVYFPHYRLKRVISKEFSDIRVSFPNGSTIDFRVTTKGSSTITKLLGDSFEISNCSGDEPSGKYDLRNISINLEGGLSKVTINSPDGIAYHYRLSHPVAGDVVFYLLEKEVRSNGKVIRYLYNDRKLIRVESCDPTEKLVYAAIDITNGENERSFTTNCGQQTFYKYEQKLQSGKLKQPHIKYNLSYPPVLYLASSPFFASEKAKYNDRFLINDYESHENAFRCTYGSYSISQTNSVDRVKTLSIPLSNHTSANYAFEYVRRVEGNKRQSTKVINPDGTSTVYQYTKKFLTKYVQRFDRSGKLCKQKKFAWDKDNRLTSIEILDGEKNLLLSKSYTYDTFGNPISETLTGNLTGLGQDSYTIKRTFSQDNRNLVLSEEKEDGETILFSYIPNSNLIASKLTKDGSQILRREFFEYDSALNLIQKSVDDGASADKNNLEGIHQRLITKYNLRRTAPFLHMPESKEELFLDNGTEQLLRRTEFAYDRYGNVCQEKVYGSDHQLSHTTNKEYNERGDLISETNALGQMASYEYDVKGRLVVSRNFSQRLSTIKQYDLKGRCIEENKVGDDGVSHLTRFEYDALDRLEKRIDPFGQVTKYTYDLISNKIIKTEKPQIHGQSNIVTQASVDAFGRELTKTDENKNITTYRYNIYNDPIEISYPNGSSETFSYTKRGKLAKNTNREGRSVTYSYDVLDRVLQKNYFSKNQKLLATESFEYSGDHLVKQVDKEGFVTLFKYDGAGRKIREEVEDKVTEFAYDPLGILTTITQQNDKNSLVTELTRDKLGNVLAKSKCDQYGQLLFKESYQYDEDGNRSSVTRYIDGKPAIEHFTYDSFNRLIHARDALGRVVKTDYNENHINDMGQRVLQKTVIDPTGICTKETYDSWERIENYQQINAKGVILSEYELLYDPYGNVIEQRDNVYANGKKTKEHRLHYSYTSNHEIATCTRAWKTDCERTTSFLYTPGGIISSKTMPSGLTLSYAYDEQGCLKSVTSSDGKLNHTFTYNKLGKLVKASDTIQNVNFQRELDFFGNVTRETFSNGMEIKKQYDDFDRVLTLQIGSYGKVQYDYDPLFLKTVTRLSNKNQKMHSHKYESYDLSGNITRESLLDGALVHHYDLLGRHTDISSPYFSEKYTYDLKGNLIDKEYQKQHSRYAYDDLNQLTQEETKDFSQKCAYDSLYNRLEVDNDTCVVNDLNELLRQGDITCEYDLDGNLVHKHTPQLDTKFTYDALNRLTCVEKADERVQFVYDPVGRCLIKLVSKKEKGNWKEADSENYLYDGQHEIGAFKADKTLKQLKVFGLKTYENFALPVALELDGNVYIPVNDPLGNVRLLLNSKDKKVGAEYDFSAFGQAIKTLEKTPFNPWRYSGKRLDPELRLISFGKRYYDPELARWLNLDPAGFVDGVNLYQYVYNNPNANMDPDGRFVVVLLPLLAGTFGAAGVTIALPSVTTLTCVALGSAAGLIAYKIAAPSDRQAISNYGLMYMEAVDKRTKDKKKGKTEKSPYTVGDNPETPPEPNNGLKWKGREEPKTGLGAWVDSKTGESFHPDLNHPEPIGPHWDYEASDGREARIYLNGTLEWK
ncbi:MAG: hypothetical protein H0X51_05220 [Parachlamydiaceae bacterium]|nr:hypothetical protein [Parachlamydiaceae bacterium]